MHRSILAIAASTALIFSTPAFAQRGHGDLAVGNVIGSNILNIFAILGTTATIHPLGARPEIFNLEIPMMVLFSIAVLPLARRGMRLVRWEGMILLVAYLVFLVVVVSRGTI